ncbi:MAG TPA: adenylate/guanylate cyclase domain-containing protein [Casimicrobiaceae bacterium]|nr:adenylate/guanylate cyclase domain-containing protein [Casimicrobiaceae bacterium]
MAADPAPAELAVLFADVSGSTRLYEELGDEAALSTIARCLAVVKDACDGHQGRLIKTIGDEAMVVFPAADHAAEAAAEIQARIAEEPSAGTQRLALRVGFHYGPALEAGGDIFGDSVNVAARLVGFANRAQVITSADTAAALSPWLRARTRELDSVTVRGKQRDIRIFELLWQDAPEDLTALASRHAMPPARMRLFHAGHERLLGDDSVTVAMGRDAQNDIVIADRMASRMHARVERRSGKFILVDHSSNGTYVTIDGDQPIRLRREELVLRGQGRISFGHGGDEAAELVFFSCEG